MPVAYFRQEKTSSFLTRFCVRVTYLPGQANVLSCRPQVSGGHLQAEKSPNLSVRALCSRYLASRAGQRIVLAVKKHAGGMF